MPTNPFWVNLTQKAEVSAYSICIAQHMSDGVTLVFFLRCIWFFTYPPEIDRKDVHSQVVALDLCMLSILPSFTHHSVHQDVHEGVASAE